MWVIVWMTSSNYQLVGPEGKHARWPDPEKTGRWPIVVLLHQNIINIKKVFNPLTLTVRESTSDVRIWRQKSFPALK